MIQAECKRELPDIVARLVDGPECNKFVAYTMRIVINIVLFLFSGRAS